MDPLSQFCHNPDRPTRGQPGFGNIRIPSRKERRYLCSTCGRTFAATRDTPFYRLKKSLDLVTIVVTPLCHGCPVQAVVAAFGLDERTVADWRRATTSRAASRWSTMSSRSWMAAAVSRRDCLSPRRAS